MLNKLCAKCGKITQADNPYCPACRQTAQAEREETLKRNAKASRKKYKGEAKYRDFYNSSAWRMLSKKRMSIDGYLCVECAKRNLATPATSVHHTVPLWMDFNKRFNLEVLISVCEPCHHRLDAQLRRANPRGCKKSLKELRHT